MQKIIYVPPGSSYDDQKKRVVLEAAEPFILSSVKGVGGVESDIISCDVVGKDGRVYQGRRKRPREIECTVYVKGSSRADMYRRRMELIGCLTAEDIPGTAYYRNDYIMVKCPAVPVLPPDFARRLQNYNEASIRLWCPDPDWLAVEAKTVSIAASEGTGFVFPFRFPISFVNIKNRITVENEGTARAPVIITITGPGENPAITNLTNGKRIALDQKTLGADEQLIINTERGNKSVKLRRNGEITDAFEYIDPSSDFWELERGKNEIIYSSDDNAEATRISINYIERYEGV